jgi:hypothetical protein
MIRGSRSGGEKFVSKMLAKDAGVEREPPGNRTLNLLIKSQLLCQLS